MLSSIHPLGERSRNNSYFLTVASHTVGGTLGGAVLGLLVGVLAFISAFAVAATDGSRLLALAVCTVLIALVEQQGLEARLPSRHHQVDETWIQKFRGWVYGFGFGFELGLGLSTIVTTGFIYLMLAAMVLSGSWVTSIGIGAIFGFVRTGLVFGTSHVSTGEQLRSLLRGVDDWSIRSRTLSIMLSSVVAMLSVAVSLS